MHYTFLRGYRGRATGERHQRAGAVISSEVPYDWDYLLASGVVQIDVEENNTDDIDLSTLTVVELQSLARERGISYGGLRKADLIRVLV